MGIAGYNRGSQAIARQIREEYAKSRQAYYSTHELPAPKLPEPKMEGPELCANSLGYYTLTDPHSKMPNMSLTRTEAADLAAYIGSLAHH